MKPVTLKLDRTRRLLLTRAAIYLLEERTGQSLGDLWRRLNEGSFKALVDLLRCCLLHEDRGLAPLEVADMLDGESVDVAEASAAVVEAIVAFLPTEGTQDEKPTKTKTRKKAKGAA